MTPPLCTVPGCGATLPDPMAPSVITCPRCGAKSEARTSAPESEQTESLSRVVIAEIESHRAPTDEAGVDVAWLLGEVRRLHAKAAAAHAAGVAEERARCLAIIEDSDAYDPYRVSEIIEAIRGPHR